MQPELPASVPDDDKVLLENILIALQSLRTGDEPLCSKYKVDVAPTCYVIRAILPPSSPFEIHLDDLLFLQSVSPSRIEHIAVAKRTSHELVIRVLDCKQRISVTSTTAFHVSATRKRKWTAILSA